MKSTQAGSRVVGLLLAAGAGRRMGRPKATVIAPDGVPWVVRAARDLRRECDDVVVVLGAGRERAEELLKGAGLTGARTAGGAGKVSIVVAARWADGMGESLRAGLDAVLAGLHSAEDERGVSGSRVPSAVLIQLVDLPDVGADVIARVAAASIADASAVLARAAYHGVPGHPVLIGADHVGPLASTLRGDTGAKKYLAARDVRLIECGDLAGGADEDFPKDSHARRH